MADNTKQVELMEVHAKAASYDYALLYMISEIKLCRTETLMQINWEECQEARFFSTDKELHIFEGENGMEAVEISDTISDNIVIKEYLLDNRFASIGNSILIQEYLEYDEDGQAYVANTRLKGIC